MTSRLPEPPECELMTRHLDDGSSLLAIRQAGEQTDPGRSESNGLLLG